MSKTIDAFAVFALGALAGAVTAWKMLEKKYREYAQEEINEMKEHYKKRYTEQHEENRTMPKLETDDRDIFTKPENRTAYNNLNLKKPADISTQKSKSKTHVITEHQFLEDDDYEKVSLDYYGGDSTLVQNDVIMDESVVGADYLEELAESTATAIYIRNEEEQIDYEISYNTESFTNDDDF